MTLYPILLIILIVLLILSAILIATSSFLLSYGDKKLIKKGGNAKYIIENFKMPIVRDYNTAHDILKKMNLDSEDMGKLYKLSNSLIQRITNTSKKYMNGAPNISICLMKWLSMARADEYILLYILYYVTTDAEKFKSYDEIIDSLNEAYKDLEFFKFFINNIIYYYENSFFEKTTDENNIWFAIKIERGDSPDVAHIDSLDNAGLEDQRAHTYPVDNQRSRVNSLNSVDSSNNVDQNINSATEDNTSLELDLNPRLDSRLLTNIKDQANMGKDALLGAIDDYKRIEATRGNNLIAATEATEATTNNGSKLIDNDDSSIKSDSGPKQGDSDSKQGGSNTKYGGGADLYIPNHNLIINTIIKKIIIDNNYYGIDIDIDMDDYSVIIDKLLSYIVDVDSDLTELVDINTIEEARARAKEREGVGVGEEAVITEEEKTRKAHIIVENAKHAIAAKASEDKLNQLKNSIKDRPRSNSTSSQASRTSDSSQASSANSQGNATTANPTTGNTTKDIIAALEKHSCKQDKEKKKMQDAKKANDSFLESLDITNKLIKYLDDYVNRIKILFKRERNLKKLDIIQKSANDHLTTIQKNIAVAIDNTLLGEIGYNTNNLSVTLDSSHLSILDTYIITQIADISREYNIYEHNIKSSITAHKSKVTTAKSAATPLRTMDEEIEEINRSYRNKTYYPYTTLSTYNKDIEEQLYKVRKARKDAKANVSIVTPTVVSMEFDKYPKASSFKDLYI
uniref:Uncharacterized protein n=1 Tax=viral metagenome TaxID=1070528 RepID=A0A6C0I1N8_9ZZZZ